jgi:hypothetical protein
LYIHQAKAIDHAFARKNVVVVTPTASGKTLCYNLPVVDSILGCPTTRALFLFPTKALAEDQRLELQRLNDAIGGLLLKNAHNGHGLNAPPKDFTCSSLPGGAESVPCALPAGIRVYAVPATRLAEQLGKRMALNIVTVGFFAAVTGLLAPDSLRKAVADSVPPATRDLNLEAFEKGLEYGLAKLQEVVEK